MLKQLLLQRPLVRLSNLKRGLIFETNASMKAVKVYSSRHLETPTLSIQWHFSVVPLPLLSETTVYEIKMYSVVRAVEHFKVYLLGREFLLRTDHAALRNLLSRYLPPTIFVQNLILRLSEYVFRIEYQRESENTFANMLSRMPFASAIPLRREIELTELYKSSVKQAVASVEKAKTSVEQANASVEKAFLLTPNRRLL